MNMLESFFVSVAELLFGRSCFLFVGGYHLLFGLVDLGSELKLGIDFLLALLSLGLHLFDCTV